MNADAQDHIGRFYMLTDYQNRFAFSEVSDTLTFITRER